MPKTIVIIASIILILHALIHLLGTAVYLKLTEIQGLTYKTTLLGGRWDLGEGGIRIFGTLWAVAAVGFVVAALAFAGRVGLVAILVGGGVLCQACDACVPLSH